MPPGLGIGKLGEPHAPDFTLSTFYKPHSLRKSTARFLFPSLLLSHPTITMSSHNLFRFQKPAWLSSTTTRTAGVYLAGALVRSLFPPIPRFLSPLIPALTFLTHPPHTSSPSVSSSSSMRPPTRTRRSTPPTSTSASSTGSR